RTHPPTTGSGPEVMVVLEIAQGCLAGVDRQGHRAAPAAVTPVRAAARDMGLATERGGAVATRAGTHPDRHAVEEHRAGLSHSPDRRAAGPTGMEGRRASTGRGGRARDSPRG